MDHQYCNASMEGIESKGREVVIMAKPAPAGACELLMRVLALALTLGAAITIGADKQTKVVSIQLLDTLPPLNVPVTAKWHYLSALVYFVVANAIACAYAAFSVLLALTNRGKTKALWTLITVLDAIMVALLFSGNGAATAVGVIGFRGNSHVQWNKVCNVFGKFCDQLAASLILSLLGSVVFLLLVVVPMLRLHR
ncbi:CASP-like protein 1E2 [Gastrolobium bilobum]|uniref:CASP-like protein 1E2 n=1 Tax=Gastrolobium bilobum TaxID=150636 RepID=UPI002AB1A8C8|nr:CASP-like protein 1E2 [Gastrolobium bilobum]